MGSKEGPAGWGTVCLQAFGQSLCQGGRALTPQAALPAPAFAANFAFVIAHVLGGQGTPVFQEAVRKCLLTAVKFALLSPPPPQKKK